MKKWGIMHVLLAIVFLFSLQIASAQIIISQPSSLYNSGDTMSILVSLKPQQNVNDFLNVNLICLNSSVQIFKNSYNIIANERKNLSIESKLDFSLIGDLQGDCYLEVNFGNEQTLSQSFEISKNLIVNINASISVLEPGQLITVTGTAKKSNGQNVNGFAESSVPGINTLVVGEVVNGEFKFDIVVPNNAKADSYILKVQAYEKDSLGQKTSSGESSTTVKVKQVVKKIDVAIDLNSIFPPGNIIYTVLLNDQTEESAGYSSTVLIYDSEGNIYDQNLALGGESNTINLPSDAKPGFWTIEASYDVLKTKRTFFVEEVEKLSYEVLNQTLAIKNIGNVLYNKDIEISIADKNEIRKINLDIGEEKRFKLLAPDGNYDISINEGINESAKPIGNSFLTGNAIGIRDLDSLSSDPKIVLWFWIILIAILLAIGIWYYRKVRLKSFTGKIPLFSFRNKNKFIPITEASFPGRNDNDEAKKMKFESYNTGTNSEIKNAKQFIPSPIIDTTKENNKREEVVVVALKIKNVDKLIDSESAALTTIEHTLGEAKSVKGRVYEQGNSKLIVFSPTITKSQENSIDAVKAAYKIDSILKEFNKKHAIKIDYGIGANSGEMFLEYVDGRPKFTAIGSTTISAKNIAEKANNEILLSMELHRKVYNIVKGEQTPNGLYKINSILDRSQHSRFIQKFMKKNEK